MSLLFLLLFLVILHLFLLFLLVFFVPVRPLPQCSLTQAIVNTFYKYFVPLASDPSSPGQKRRPALAVKKLKSTLQGGASLDNLDKENARLSPAKNRPRFDPVPGPKADLNGTCLSGCVSRRARDTDSYIDRYTDRYRDRYKQLHRQIHRQ